MNRNRNWYADPSQGGGRSAHDYGRSGRIQSDFGNQGGYRVAYALTAVAVFVVVAWGFSA